MKSIMCNNCKNWIDEDLWNCPLCKKENINRKEQTSLNEYIVKGDKEKIAQWIQDAKGGRLMRVI